MTAIPATERPNRKVNPLRIVSSALFLIFGILSLLMAVFSTSLRIFDFETFFKNDVLFSDLSNFLTAQLVIGFAASVIALVIAVYGLLSRNKWLQPILGFALFALVFPLQWLAQMLLGTAANHNIFTWTQEYINDGLMGWLAFAALVAAVISSVVASLISTEGVAKNADQNTTAIPAVKQNAAQQTAGQSNLTNLPMFALIGAFIIPLAGIILGHLSLNYMKKGQLSTQNKGMATTGLILGYVFVGLGFLTGLILFIVLIVSAASGF
jgi:hypothetical protein